MKTIKDVSLFYKQGLQHLYDARETGAITLLVLEELTGFSRAKLKAFPDDEVPAQAVEKLAAVLAELKTGKPVQYVLGTASFYGLNFLVNPATLIPRPETEELVEWILSLGGTRQLAAGKQGKSILDIGTGSGCIAISLKKNFPAATVTAVDISSGALKTAKQNAVINDVEIEFLEDNILDIKSNIQSLKFDIIVSNPPYVTINDKLQMQQNVTGFEPHSALFVPEDDPLIFYRTIVHFATTHLAENGMLFFEINENLGEEIIELLNDKRFKNIELKQDMSGRDRMIKATLT